MCHDVHYITVLMLWFQNFYVKYKMCACNGRHSIGLCILSIISDSDESYEV